MRSTFEDLSKTPKTPKTPVLARLLAGLLAGPPVRPVAMAGLMLLLVAMAGCPGDGDGEGEGQNTFDFVSADLASQNDLAAGAAEDGSDDPADGSADGAGGIARAVVEPDVIRRDGNLLYILNQYRGLTIVDLDTEVILKQVATLGFPRDLYFDQGRAYVFVANALDFEVVDGVIGSASTESRFYVVDVADPANAAIVSSFDLPGDLVDSRLVGDVLYAVTAEQGWYYGETWIREGVGVGIGVTDDVEGGSGSTGGGGGGSADGDSGGGTVDSVDGDSPDGAGDSPPSDGTGGSDVPPEPAPPPDGGGEDPDVGGGDDPDVGSGDGPAVESALSWVTSIRVADPDNIEQVAQLALNEYGQIIHVTSEAIFVAGADYSENGTSTSITFIDISDPLGTMEIAGQVQGVPGYVADRFKMDAWEGVLRVVSSTWEDGQQVYITTIRIDTLETLASVRLEGAEGESLFATRFDGPRGYIVTYLVVDPLFVIDLSDPTAPQLLGEPLVVPGYSTHIEPQGDLLIALGVDNTDGGQKVSVSLYDVSGSPILLDSESFGDGWVWSSAYDDVKALTILDDVIIVPFGGWSGYSGGFQRLQFIAYDPEAADPELRLELLGAVDLQGTILRSFEYDTDYYGVTTEQLAVIDGSDLVNPQVVSSLTLAEYVADFVEVSSELNVEIISSFDQGVTIVRTVDPNGATLGEAFVELGEYHDVFVYGQSVVLVGIVRDDTLYGGALDDGALDDGAQVDGAPYDGVPYEEPRYQVAVVDVSVPATPVVAANFPVNVLPYYGYYYYDYGYAIGIGGDAVLVDAVDGGGVLETGVAQKSMVAPEPFGWTSGNTGFLLGDTLVLRSSSKSFDTAFGDREASEALALVDLSIPGWTSTVGLGFGSIVSLDAVDGLLYVGTKERVGDPNHFPPEAANFIREFDVLAGEVGPAVNVPGVFVQYDSVNDVLTLRDFQWGTINYYDVRSTLQTVSWDGSDTPQSIATLELPQTAGTLLGAGRSIFVDSYSSGYSLHEITVGTDGGMDLGDGILVTEGWGNLVGARENNAFVSVGGGALARYDFSAGGELSGAPIVTMSFPRVLRHGEHHTYAPLGYFGMVSFSL